jgi:hypothetical protein
MRQVGWSSACSGVTVERSAGPSRKGPPEAVRTTRSTPSRGSPTSVLVEAGVLGVDRREPRARCPRGTPHERAGADHRLLGGERHVPSRLQRGADRCQSAEAGHGRDDRVDVCRGRRRQQPRVSRQQPRAVGQVRSTSPATSGSQLTSSGRQRRTCSIRTSATPSRGERDDAVARPRRPRRAPACRWSRSSRARSRGGRTPVRAMAARGDRGRAWACRILSRLPRRRRPGALAGGGAWASGSMRSSRLARRPACWCASG